MKKKFIIVSVLLIIILILGKVVIDMKKDILMETYEEQLIESMDRNIIHYYNYMDTRDEVYLEKIVHELKLCIDVLGDMESNGILQYDYIGILSDVMNKLECYGSKLIHIEYLIDGFLCIKKDAMEMAGYIYLQKFANVNEKSVYQNYKE